jgi:hypothetical protein
LLSYADAAISLKRWRREGVTSQMFDYPSPAAWASR